MHIQRPLLIYIILTLAAWVALFVRAAKKRSLIKLATEYFSTTPLRETWTTASSGIWRYLGDLPCLRLLKEYRSRLPSEVATAYTVYISTSRITYGLIVLLFGFALVAHWIFL